MTATTSEPRWLNEEEMRLWRSILAASRKLERTMEVSLQNNDGMSSSEYAVLVELADVEDNQLRLRELCARLEWDRSRASHQITRMVKRGLVRKVRCVGDARGVVVEITEDGKDRLAAAVPSHVETVRQMLFDVLDYKDIKKLQKFYEALLGAKVDGVPEL